ncbi:recombinase RecT [Tetragenococcus halophilus]|uniref:recombinase RecT n=1 Tax=Tetragenococcus halophilus TaxID=51669 RepID=UPI002A97B5C5|nr:recombinase RecT [Tetragenococcus halophilus]
MANNQVPQQKNLTDKIGKRIAEMKDEGLQLPLNYNYSNALKSAYFAIEKTKDRSNKPALEVCTTESIANTLLNMVIQGLSPAKTQCYFVVYGNELQMQRSYFGTQAVLKRLEDVKDIWAEVIHEGDTFQIGSKKGRTIVKEFEPKFENMDNDIVGAYAVVEKENGELVYTVMTQKEIQASWNQSRSGGGVQKKFPQEMAKRTVINRAAKTFINTSNDDDRIAEAINDTTENEYESDREVKQAEPVKAQELENKLKDKAKNEPKQERPTQYEPEEEPDKKAKGPVEEVVQEDPVQQYEQSRMSEEEKVADKAAHEAVQEDLFGRSTFTERRDAEKAQSIEDIPDEEIPF